MLVEHNYFTDWMPHMGKVIKEYGVNSVLEFGLGEGTRFFVDMCRYVTSIEFAQDDVWFNQCQNWFGDSVRWFGEYYEVEDGFTDEIKEVVVEALMSKPDLVFVDSGIHCRADIANLCFDKVDIIALHDINHGQEEYGWGRLKPTKGYELIDFKAGQGTRFYIRKNES